MRQIIGSEGVTRAISSVHGEVIMSVKNPRFFCAQGRYLPGRVLGLLGR